MSDSLGTALVMSRIMHTVATKISAAIGSAITSGGILSVVFRVAVIFIVCTIVLEIFRVMFKVIGGGGSLWTHLADPELLKQFMRASVCITFGLGAWLLVVGTSYPISSVPMLVKEGEISSVAAAGANGLRPITNLLSPDGKIETVASALDSVAKNVNAYTIVSTAQEEAMKIKATQAAHEAWDASMTEQGITSSDPAYQGTPQSTYMSAEINQAKAMTSFFGMIKDAWNFIRNVGLGFVVRIVYLVMYSALDLMIVRVLWANVIYMLIGYKIAWGILPTCIVLSFFQSQRGLVVNCVKLLFVYAISLTIISTAAQKIFVDTDTVKEIVAKVETKAYASESETDKADMIAYAKTQLAEYKFNNPNPTYDGYIQHVQQTAGVVSTQPFSGKSILVAPMAVFMALMLCITLLGKMATVVNDAVSGSMSFHN